MTRHTQDSEYNRPGRRDRFRTETASASRRVNPVLVMGVAALVLLAALVYVITSRQSGSLAAAGASGSDLSFAVSDFSDGVARFYTYTTASGQPVRFFVMKSADGVIRAAFDACDTCYRERRGYRQEGTEMVCNNCGQSFRSSDINVLRGGCNPAPLERQVTGDRVTLTASALAAGASYF